MAVPGMNLLNHDALLFFWVAIENRPRTRRRIAMHQMRAKMSRAGFTFCRCGKEVHNVVDEDPSIRLIRLLAVTPFQAKMDLKLQQQQQGGDYGLASSNRPSKLDFNSPARGSAVTLDAPASPLDWVPPTDDSQLAIKYMEQLPLAKQPITGSQAAVDRKIALDRQLPSHDLDPEQCSNLSANEKRKMEEYVKNVKQHVVGQGLIQECPPRPSGKLPPPPPQLDRILGEKVNTLSLQESANAKRPILPAFVTAKPFAIKADAPSAQQIKRMSTKPHAGMSSEFGDLPPPPPDMLLMDASYPAPAAAPETPPPPPPPPQLVVDELLLEESSHNKRQDPVREFFDFLDEQEGKKLPGKLKSPFLHQAAASGTFNATAKPFGASPGTSPNLNQRNPNTKVGLAAPVAVAGTGSRGSSPRLGERAPPVSGPTGRLSNNNNNNGSRQLLTTDFDYFPEEQVAKSQNNNNPVVPTIQNQSNNNNNNQSPLSNRRPSAHSHPCGSDNNKYVTAQIPAAGGPIQQQQQQEVFQDPEGLVGAWSCRKCTQPIEPGTIAIFAERAGSDKCWHPQCFVCSICHEMLADLIYFFVDDDVFCGRHYAEQMKIPRCKACDELIFAPEYTSAEGASWHMDHFCCWICDTPLAGHQYTPIEGQPHCLDCGIF